MEQLFDLIFMLSLMVLGAAVGWPIATLLERTHWFERFVDMDNIEDDDT